MLKSALRFSLTGAAATLVHLAVAIGLIGLGVAPLVGNVAAFLMAFMVSFWGHHMFTFVGHGGAAAGAFGKFVLVALAGFLINESLLFLLLKTGAVTPETATLVSTLTAAASTFALSRSWAFAKRTGAH
jgi:putative flippase GtrA